MLIFSQNFIAWLFAITLQQIRPWLGNILSVLRGCKNPMTGKSNLKLNCRRSYKQALYRISDSIKYRAILIINIIAFFPRSQAGFAASKGLIAVLCVKTNAFVSTENYCKELFLVDFHGIHPRRLIRYLVEISFAGLQLNPGFPDGSRKLNGFDIAKRIRTNWEGRGYSDTTVSLQYRVS